MAWCRDLTADEKDAIEELRKRTIKDFTPKMLEDETIFYRFLKARDFDLQNAELMLRKHMAWRKEYQVDTILTDYKAPEGLLTYSPLSFIGFDKEGCLVRYVDFGGSDSIGIISAFRRTDIIKFNLQVIESDLERIKEHNKELKQWASQIVYVQDFARITFAKVTSRKVLDLLLLSAKMYQDNYPERIKLMINTNVSVYFNLMFSIVKAVVASNLLEKIKNYGTVGWKECLLEFTDADVLPAFLGGTRTDPDGNPLCKTMIRFAEDVPESMYMKKSERRLSLSPGVKKLTVTRFAKSEIRFDVNEPDSMLEWEFETKSKDIGFGVFFKGKSHKDKADALIPKQRIDTCIEPEAGMYKCEKAGTYTIIFDNSYSWLYPKEIYYRARIMSPNEEGKSEWT